jgi:creatinine amidohydrolase
VTAGAVVRLAEMTYEEIESAVRAPRSCVLLPVGSVEPHGPHLPLGTDTVLSDEACARAVSALAARGVSAWIAPALPYGVTDYAAGFPGAIGVPAVALEAFLRAVIERFLADGFAHVCVVNNHLEPAHDAAVRAAVSGLPAGRASVACPLTRRWGRTLSDEFKRGECHAGRYETSLVLAAGARTRETTGLAPVAVSLSDAIRSGMTTFAAMGLTRAYAGAPAEATREEGDALYAKLVDMIVGEVAEALGA